MKLIPDPFETIPDRLCVPAVRSGCVVIRSGMDIAGLPTGDGSGIGSDCAGVERVFEFVRVGVSELLTLENLVLEVDELVRIDHHRHVRVQLVDNAHLERVLNHDVTRICARIA